MLRKIKNKPNLSLNQSHQESAILNAPSTLGTFPKGAIGVYWGPTRFRLLQSIYKYSTAAVSLHLSGLLVYWELST